MIASTQTTLQGPQIGSYGFQHERSQNRMTHPTRIQRRRTKGYRLPEGAVYIGRGSKWGNPFVIQAAPKGMVGAWPQTPNRYAVVDTRDNAPHGNYKLFLTFADAAAYATEMYRDVAVWDILRADRGALIDLMGRDVACWCRPENPCHGDVLLEYAARMNPQTLELEA